MKVDGVFGLGVVVVVDVGCSIGVGTCLGIISVLSSSNSSFKEDE